METTKHTPEPWGLVGEPNGYTVWNVVDDGVNPGCVGRILARVCGAAVNVEEEEANGARIVACVNACAGMADPAAEIAALKQVGIANSVMHLEAVDAAAENAILRDQLDRICTDGFGNQDTIGGEPADDYVLRQLAAMREVIREAHRVLRDILKNYECGHLIDSQCETALAKLQRFITP